MWVRPRPVATSRPLAQTAGVYRQEPSRTPSILDREHHSSDDDGRDPSTVSTAAAQPNIKRRQQRSVLPVKAAQRRRVIAPEAEEKKLPSSGSSCAESGEDAQSLYRSAILGVRNANHARQQARTATVNCPVCAKLAAVLEHFL